MLRRIFAICMSFLTFLLSYGELKVDSFVSTPFDISARKYERVDLNKVPCALIKLQLPVEGCKFEGNVIESKYDVNEYWIYMSTGSKRLDIKCPGQLKLSVVFGNISEIGAVESGMTYVLSVSGFENTGSAASKDPGVNYLILNIEPGGLQGLSVKIDGELQTVDRDQAVTLLKYGAHSYVVEAKGYDTLEGTAEVAKGEKTEVNVILQSAMARLSVTTADPDASISINSQNRGTDSWSGLLAPGNYMVEVTKEGYKPYSEMVILSKRDNRQLSVPALTPITGSLSVNYKPVGSLIALDGNTAGTTPAILQDVKAGSHTVRISREGYDDKTVSVYVQEGETASVEGSLNKSQAVPVPAASQTETKIPESQPVVEAVPSQRPNASYSARTDYHNLDLCALRDGKTYFFSTDEWKDLPSTVKAEYDKKGVVVIGDDEAFVVGLKCSDEIKWREAVDQYGEDYLPAEAQCRAMSKLYNDINKAIVAFGGNGPRAGAYYWGKSKDDTDAWIISTLFGDVKGHFKTDRVRARPVAPLSDLSAISAL